jgi:RNA polymerase sigma-70 factor (ECF subfamily)
VRGAVTLRDVTERHDYARIFREAAPALWRALYGFTGGRRHVAEDALSEAFARAIERGGDVRDPVPYLYRTAFRIASAELKRERRTGSMPYDTVRESPDLIDLFRALDALSPKQRAVVILHEAEGYPLTEVAGLIGTTPATARVHLHRARKRLRDLLGAEEVDPR